MSAVDNLKNMAAFATPVLAGLLAKGYLTRLFDSASGLSAMTKKYKKAMAELHAIDTMNGLTVAGKMPLADVLENPGEIDLQGKISPKKMQDAGIEHLVILSPKSLMLRHVDTDGKPRTIRYDLDGLGKYLHALWIRQFLDDPKKMREEIYRKIDTKHVSKDRKLSKKVRAAVRGSTSAPGGLKGKLMEMFGYETLSGRLQGVEDTLYYGVAVMLDSGEDELRAAVDGGYMFLKTGNVIYAIATTRAEEELKESICAKQADFWTPKEALAVLIKANKKEVEILAPHVAEELDKKLEDPSLPVPSA